MKRRILSAAFFMVAISVSFLSAQQMPTWYTNGQFVRYDVTEPDGGESTVLFVQNPCTLGQVGSVGKIGKMTDPPTVPAKRCDGTDVMVTLTRVGGQNMYFQTGQSNLPISYLLTVQGIRATPKEGGWNLQLVSVQVEVFVYVSSDGGLVIAYPNSGIGLYKYATPVTPSVPLYRIGADNRYHLWVFYGEDRKRLVPDA